MYAINDVIGFVPRYIRPLFCEGKGPFRWVALSGDPSDIAVTDETVLSVVSDDADGMVKEGLAFAKIASNIVVKVALTTAGLEAISRLKSEGIKTNCTLIFTANQGLMAAKAGASLISPFVGRLDDISEDGMTVIRELAEIFANYEGLDHCEILAASIRHPRHVTESALAGAHVATMPLKVLEQMTKHPLTDKGIAIFKADWAKAKGVK